MGPDMHKVCRSLGVALIALILGQGYRRAVSAFRRDSALGALLLAYVVTALTYNIGFRMLRLSCCFFPGNRRPQEGPS
jgi:hypothetical protein